MFDIRGDAILFDGYTVGTLHALQPIGIRIEAENLLLEIQDPAYFITETDHLQEVEQADTDGYNRGLAEGRADARAEAEPDAQQREKEAYAEGKADAMADLERAQDVVRVDALLAELKKAHDVLWLWQGVQEPGAYRKRPSKLSECKKAMQGAASTLRLALHAYQRPNGA